jgi:hypothetical protein
MKPLAARDKTTSNCIFTLGKMGADTSWAEHALSPSCGITLPFAACDPRPALGRFNQGVYSVKNLVRRVWYWLLTAGGNTNSPMKRQGAQLINSEI